MTSVVYGSSFPLVLWARDGKGSHVLEGCAAGCHIPPWSATASPARRKLLLFQTPGTEPGQTLKLKQLLRGQGLKCSYARNAYGEQGIAPPRSGEREIPLRDAVQLVTHSLQMSKSHFSSTSAHRRKCPILPGKGKMVCFEDNI